MALRPIKSIAKMLAIVFLNFAIILGAGFIIGVFWGKDDTSAYLRLPIILGLVALPFAWIALIGRSKPRYRIASGGIVLALSVFAGNQIRQTRNRLAQEARTHGQLVSAGIELLPKLSIRGFLRDEVQDQADPDEQTLETNLYATIENQSSSDICHVRVRYSVDVDGGHLSEDVSWLWLEQFDEAVRANSSTNSGMVQISPVLAAMMKKTGIVDSFRRSWHPRNPQVEIISVLPCQPKSSN